MTDTTEDRIEGVAQAIGAWSAVTKANVSLASYSYEIEAWKSITGVCSVSRILEVGCGNGLFLATAVAQGFAESGLGVDPGFEGHASVADGFKRAEDLCLKLGLGDRAQFQRQTLQELLLSEPENRYDLVIFRNSLHHMFEREQEQGKDADVRAHCISDLASANRLIRPRGHLYILEAPRPSAAYGTAYNLYRRAKGVGPIDWEGKRSRKEWEAILAAASYGEVKSVALPLNKWIESPLGRRFGRLFSATMLATGQTPRGQLES